MLGERPTLNVSFTISWTEEDSEENKNLVKEQDLFCLPGDHMFSDTLWGMMT